MIEMRPWKAKWNETKNDIQSGRDTPAIVIPANSVNDKKKHWEQTSPNVILTRLNGIFKYRHRRTFVGTNLRNLMNFASVYRNFLSLCFTVVDMP